MNAEKAMPRAQEKFAFVSYPVPLQTVRRYARLHSRTVALKGYRMHGLLIRALLAWARKISWDTAFCTGTAIGRLFYLLKIRRKVAMVNLDIVYGGQKTAAEKDAIYKASLLNCGRVLINYLKLPYQDTEFWKSHCKLINAHLFDKAIRHGKGVLLITGHIGLMDLAGGRLGQCGYPVALVGKRIKNPFWDKFVLDSRLAMNLGSIRHRNSMKRILTGIRQGETIVMALDQNMRRRQGIFLDWMGRPASSVYASAYLMRKTGVAVIAGYSHQKGPQSFELVFTEQVPWQPYPQDPDQEIRINAQKHADAVQKIIYRHPELWLWIHRRFRTQPEGLEDPYF
jgi:KDO2-lipid IV(A) lauroyltransferase